MRMTYDKTHVLDVSSQRSGTTLLSKDMKSLKNIGNPLEYVKEVRRQFRNESAESSIAFKAGPLPYG